MEHNTVLISIAADAAHRAHRNQFRKDGVTPYVTHPQRVAACVEKYGGDDTALISAWLHDVIEDCECGGYFVWSTLKGMCLPKSELQEILSVILALTKNDKIQGKKEKLADSLYRINTYAPHQATLVKICDRIDNLSDGKEQGETFLSYYLPLTDQLIDTLYEGAILHGYEGALNELIELRASF